MEEEIEIILRAIDEASSTFDSVGSSAEEALSGIESEASSMESEFTSAEESATSLGDAISSVDGSGMENTAQGAGQVSEETSNASGEMENLSGIIEGLAGVTVFSEMANTIMDLADKAGSFNDSMTRASLEAQGAGVSVGEMKDTISDLSVETGRAGGQIRETFIKATARGVTDMDSFKKMMEGAGAQAFLLGTDVQTMGNKFSQMAMRSTLMERSLAETGITMGELATAMGMSGATADEVKAKWEELDTNQRAAILGQAAAMNEGKTANEEYKHSWEGLHNQLDIAKGRIERLIGEVFLPVLIPAIELASKVLGGLGDVISAVMDGPFGTIISVIGSVVAVIALAIPAYMAISAAITFLQASAIPAAAALWALVAPLLPFIAIGAAIILIIYEIGKAFGWWTDASSMIDAISAGLGRLWSAFINHPDVQAMLSAISSALSTLWGWIQQAGQAVLEFFGITTGGNFDIVHALIVGIGEAWAMITEPIREVISIFQQFQDGQIGLIDVITQVGSVIGTVWWSIVSTIGTLVLQLVANLLSWAIQAGLNVLTGIATYLSQVPMRVATYLLNTLTQFISIGARWVSQARSKASQVVNGIVSFLRQLPGRALSALLGVVSSIVNAGAQWVSNAKSKASEVVSSVTNTLTGLPGQISSALSGVVDAITKPFRDAYDTLTGIVDNIKSKASEVANISLPTGWGGETAYGGETALPTFGGDGGTVIRHESEPIEVNVNENITLDLVNVPGHIDTNTLITMLSDREVLRSLTGNKDFQSLDAKVKEQLNFKVNRSRGI